MHRPLSILLVLTLAGSAAAQTPDLATKPEDPASTVHPRRFGVPGGIGQTRGWYVWHKFDAKTSLAEVSHEGSREKFTVRVLPWLTTYRHLAYGAHPDELLPGERVNCFFNPSDKQQRAYLVHFQDEMCQMKGHNHAWQIVSPLPLGEGPGVTGFTARVMAGDKPLDEKPAEFQIDPKCKVWRDGTIGERANVKSGERVYLTWCYEGNKRIVKLLSDAASLEAIQSESKKRIAERVKREGMTGFIEDVTKDKTRVLIFATWWQQAGDLKPGGTLRLQADGAEPIAAKLVSRKNLGTYGSGCSELFVDGLDAKQIEVLRGWMGSKVMRVFGP